MEDKIYQFILNFITSRGYSPSVREIGESVGLESTSSVHRYIHRLVERGKITMDGNKSRTIALVGYKIVKEQ